MSIGEIKQEATRLGSEEVIHLAAWFHHLARRRDPGYLESLDDAFEAVDNGDQMSLDDYRRLSQELDQSGL